MGAAGSGRTGFWPEDDAALKAMAAEGKTAQEIGDRLARSPNAVHRRSRQLQIQLVDARATNTGGETWSDAEWGLAQALNDAGLSYTLIGIKIGKSKNAIAGRFKRKGLTSKRYAMRSDKRAEPPAEEIEEIAPECDVTLEEIEDWQCRWPVGDPLKPEFRMCGAYIEQGRPYCEYHGRKHPSPNQPAKLTRGPPEYNSRVYR